MDPNELFHYMTEGAKWLAIGGTSTYIGIMLSDPVSTLFSKRIRNQQELDTVVEEESQKLGLEGIKGILSDKSEARAYHDNNGTPTIKVGESDANRSIVRHELYHHFKGDCKPIANKWLKEAKYWLIQEPRACLYQSLGIKL